MINSRRSGREEERKRHSIDPTLTAIDTHSQPKTKNNSSARDTANSIDMEDDKITKEREREP
jgi:hypothetical protein